MAIHTLIDVEHQDIEDLLLEVEKSLDIKFAFNELAHIKTFGELCDHIKNKVELDDISDCTTQQAFYKVRQAFVTLNNNNTNITPDTLLIDVLPKQTRISSVKQIESNLGFKIFILRPRHIISFSLAGALILSIIFLFINFKIGGLGLIVSLTGIYISRKTGKELHLKTVGELVKKIARENYLKSRRNPNTVNKLEFEKMLTEWFIDNLGLEPMLLTRESEFEIIFRKKREIHTEATSHV
jgi:hypothetical protein